MTKWCQNCDWTWNPAFCLSSSASAREGWRARHWAFPSTTLFWPPRMLRDSKTFWKCVLVVSRTFSAHLCILIPSFHGAHYCLDLVNSVGHCAADLSCVKSFCQVGKKSEFWEEKGQTISILLSGEECDMNPPAFVLKGHQGDSKLPGVMSTCHEVMYIDDDLRSARLMMIISKEDLVIKPECVEQLAPFFPSLSVSGLWWQMFWFG